MKLYSEAPSGAVLRARRLRRDATEAEKRLWRALRERLPAYKWRRQVPVGPYIADLVCLAERLIVEVDGGHHTPEQDAVRTRFLQTQGFRVIRFWNNDVLANTIGVLETISLALWEREGAPQARKVEDVPTPSTLTPTPLPQGEGLESDGRC